MAGSVATGSVGRSLALPPVTRLRAVVPAGAVIPAGATSGRAGRGRGG